MTITAQPGRMAFPLCGGFSVACAAVEGFSRSLAAAAGSAPTIRGGRTRVVEVAAPTAAMKQESSGNGDAVVKPAPAINGESEPMDSHNPTPRGSIRDREDSKVLFPKRPMKYETSD